MCLNSVSCHIAPKNKTFTVTIMQRVILNDCYILLNLVIYVNYKNVLLYLLLLVVSLY